MLITLRVADPKSFKGGGIFKNVYCSGGPFCDFGEVASNKDFETATYNTVTGKLNVLQAIYLGVIQCICEGTSFLYLFI